MEKNNQIIKPEETLFIVSGFMRTGTSMMMKALETGGIETVYAKNRDEIKDVFADKNYNPNDGGLYELERTDYLSANFPRKFKGKLIKALLGALDRMRVMPKIKIIVMKRNPEEIRQSYFAFFGQKLPVTDKQLEEMYKETIMSLANRKDTEYKEFWYRDVVKEPLKYFQELKEWGWPIDPQKSAQIVDPSLLRYKLESLEVGIV